MKPLRNLLTEEQIEELASRSNFRYGKSLLDDGGITVIKSNVFNLIAEIKQGEHLVRTVKLESTPKGLRWKCSCTSKKNFFCEHCVAIGLFSVSS
jgi:uncharacterized Zn finger protein